MRPPVGEEGHQRVLCAVTFGTVGSVSYRGFRRSDEDRILCLLAIRCEPQVTASEYDPSRVLRRCGDPARRRAHSVPRHGPRRAVADPVAAAA